jgi:uncharacterized Fe-S cluster-containing MiaB family protein
MTIEDRRPGALTHQLQTILKKLETPAPDRLKIYNASNFFDSRAVHPDLARIAALLSFLRRDRRVARARSDQRTGVRWNSELEVAMGLETVHPVPRRPQ